MSSSKFPASRRLLPTTRVPVLSSSFETYLYSASFFHPPFLLLFSVPLWLRAQLMLEFAAQLSAAYIFLVLLRRSELTEVHQVEGPEGSMRTIFKK